jgi:hypothetical protein
MLGANGSGELTTLTNGRFSMMCPVFFSIVLIVCVNLCKLIYTRSIYIIAAPRNVLLLQFFSFIVPASSALTRRGSNGTDN